MNNEIRWRLAPLDDAGLPEFIANRALPDPATARCELCDARPRQPLSTMLIVDGPDGLPVPFLICASSGATSASCTPCWKPLAPNKRPELFLDRRTAPPRTCGTRTGTNCPTAWSNQ